MPCFLGVIMLDFRSIHLEDKPFLEEILQNSKEVSCENTFVNLYVWQKAYHNKIAFKNGNLFIRYGQGKNVSYRLPIGGNLEEGLREIIAHCEGEYPVFWSPINQSFSRLPSWFSEKYNIIPTRDGFDYIYLTEDLAELKGKKYHSKRNHISAFSKKYNWNYRDITSENTEEILSCAEEWYSLNADRLDNYALCEKKGIEIVLKNLERLNVTGGAIFIENKAVAFTLGTPINDKVFDVFAEKALPEFGEAYTVINNEFAKRLKNYKYLNREDDMGLEGLRKAKLSYKPTVILEKYSFIPKPDPEIYRESFGEDKEFEKLLFKNPPETLKIEGKTVSQLFLLPCSIKSGEETLNAKYIYAAATKKSERKKGYMSKLLKRVIKENDILILRPASQELKNYYKKFGFKEFAATDTENPNLYITPLENFGDLALLEGRTNEGDFPLMALNSPIDLKGVSFPFTMP